MHNGQGIISYIGVKLYCICLSAVFIKQMFIFSVNTITLITYVYFSSKIVIEPVVFSNNPRLCHFVPKSYKKYRQIQADIEKSKP